MIFMKRAVTLLFCSAFLFSGTLSNLLILQANAQSSNPADFAEDSDQTSNDGPVEPTIKETTAEVSLEKEYSERGVDWHAWAEKVAGAVWDPLIDDRAMIAGTSVVKWQVTSDNHVHINSIRTPFPGGANTLVAAIKKLDGNPILAFPRGSGKTVVDRIAGVRGPAVMRTVHGRVRVYP